MLKYPWFERFFHLHKRSPNFLLAAWFFILLLLGTLLLALPWSHREGGPEVPLLAALFTAVSAFCVTGLTVVDTHDAFSFFGQLVILVLIELGGVGIMTFANLAAAMLGRRLSMAGQAALTDTLFQNDAALEFRSIFRSLLKAVVLIQLAGVAFLYLCLHGDGRSAQFNLWSAVFHSVSAFCNAGFSIYRNNLEPVGGNIPFLAVIAVLIVLGGVGHGVLAEIYRLPRYLLGREQGARWLSLNSRVTLLMTGILLTAGALLMTAADYWYGSGGRAGIVHSIFHSVSARTAGFNSAPVGGIPLPTCLILCALMFIGGCPGSCAGGVKTTSLAIWIARIPSNLRHDTRVNLLGYTMPTHLISKARIIIALSTLWVIAGVVLLTLCHPDKRLDILLFEQVSAFGTVGLSMGLTTELTDISAIWIIMTMIMGKFGPMTVALWMVPHSTRADIGRPEGRVMIG